MEYLDDLIAATSGRSLSMVKWPKVRGYPVMELEHGAQADIDPPETEDEVTPGFFFQCHDDKAIMAVLFVMGRTMVAEWSLLMEKRDGAYSPIHGTMESYIPSAGIRHYSRDFPDDAYGSFQTVQEVIQRHAKAFLESHTRWDIEMPLCA